MSKTKKIISILLAMTMFVATLVLLCSCYPFIEVHIDGIYAVLDTSTRTANVYGFDKDGSVGAFEPQVCIIPDTIFYDDHIYTVTELSSGWNNDSEFVVGGHVKQLVIPQTVKSIDLLSFAITDTFDYLEEIQVSAYNEYYASLGGVLYSKDYSTLIMYPPAKRDSTMYIHKEVTQIFEDQRNYSNIYVEKVNVEVGNTVFSAVDGILLSNYGTRLEYVPYAHGGIIELPDGVTTISKWSLRYANVEHLYLPMSICNVEYVDDIQYNPLRYVANLYFEEAEPQYIVVWDKYLMEVHSGVTRENFREIAK